MEREEFIRVARQVSTWEKGTIPFRAAFDQLIAEFDRLNEIIKNQSSLINNMGKRGATLQAQLAKILEKQLDEAQSENEELKVENKEFADVIVQNMAGRRPDFSGLIEADKLREENEKLSTKVATLQAQLDRISEPEQLYREKKAYICAGDIVKYDIHSRVKAYLDKISEPYHYSRDKAEYPWIRHEGKADGCPICNPPPSEKYHYAEAYPKSGLSMLHKGDKEDCPICNPKPSENKELHARVWASERSQPLERRCYVGGRWILLQDCRVCNPKPSEKPARCPECHETKYINRVVAVADWELHPIYVIATCLNCNPSGDRMSQETR